MHASLEGHAAAVRLLLEAGADKDAKNEVYIHPQRRQTWSKCR